MCKNKLLNEQNKNITVELLEEKNVLQIFNRMVQICPEVKEALSNVSKVEKL